MAKKLKCWKKDKKLDFPYWEDNKGEAIFILKKDRGYIVKGKKSKFNKNKRDALNEAFKYMKKHNQC